MNIIETQSLTKSFGDTLAVDNVSLHVKEGEIYGFLGLNGAGKTTAIRLMLGMIYPDKGSCFLFGEKPQQASSLWNKVGYIVETPHSYPNLSVYENLRLIARLRDIKDKSAIDQVIDKLHLSQYQNKKEKHLSMGNKQRLGIAKALIHRPKLLMLDEPINGLDPAGIVEIREYLLELVKEEGTSIFLSSHILTEIARLATRIGIVHEGILVKEINTLDLEEKLIKKLIVDTTDNRKATEIIEKSGIQTKAGPNKTIECTQTDALEYPEKISLLLSNSGLPPKHISIFEEDLESYFLRIIGSKKPNYETTIAGHKC